MSIRRLAYPIPDIKWPVFQHLDYASADSQPAVQGFLRRDAAFSELALVSQDRISKIHTSLNPFSLRFGDAFSVFSPYANYMDEFTFAHRIRVSNDVVNDVWIGCLERVSLKFEHDLATRDVFSPIHGLFITRETAHTFSVGIVTYGFTSSSVSVAEAVQWWIERCIKCSLSVQQLVLHDVDDYVNELVHDTLECHLPLPFFQQHRRAHLSVSWKAAVERIRPYAKMPSVECRLHSKSSATDPLLPFHELRIFVGRPALSKVIGEPVAPIHLYSHSHFGSFVFFFHNLSLTLTGEHFLICVAEVVDTFKPFVPTLVTHIRPFMVVP